MRVEVLFGFLPKPLNRFSDFGTLQFTYDSSPLLYIIFQVNLFDIIITFVSWFTNRIQNLVKWPEPFWTEQFRANEMPAQSSGWCKASKNCCMEMEIYGLIFFLCLLFLHFLVIHWVSCCNLSKSTIMSFFRKTKTGNC